MASYYAGWRVVAGTFTAQLFVIGFFTYAVSLMVAPVKEEFDVSLQQVMYSLTAGTIVGLAIQPLAGILVDRFSVRWLMSSGTVLFGVGLLGLALSTTIWQYIVLFGVTMSVATSFAGSLSSSAVISRWFSTRRGFALGISAIGTSIGGVLVPLLVSWWIADYGWRTALEFLAAGVFLVMLPIVVFCIKDSPGDSDHPEAPSTGIAASQPEVGLDTIIKNPYFWWIGFSLGLLFASYSATLANLSPYAFNLGLGEERASSLIMAVAIFGLLGKLLFGMAADRISLRLGLWIAQGMVLLALVVLSVEPQYGMMLVGTSLLGLAAGGMLPIWGAMMAHVFGLASYGRAMGMMGPLITLCIMPSFPIMGRLFDQTGNYSSAFHVFMGAIVIAAALLIPVRLVTANSMDAR
jgi:MFS family permease